MRHSASMKEPSSGARSNSATAADATRPGRTSRTRDYTRHGTASLFAAFDVKAGTVIGKCTPRHRTQEFRNCLDVHAVMDNYDTHKQG